MKHHLFLSFLAIAVLSNLSANSHAQNKTGANWLSDIKIRKSAQTGSDDASKPATLNYTSPGEGQSSYATDIAFSKLLLNFERGEGASHYSWEPSAFVETHRNTLSNKKQDTSFVGFNLAGQYGSPATAGQQGSYSRSLVTIPRASLLYGQDKVADTKSVLLQTDITWLHGGYALNQEKFIGPVSFMWSPIFGVEHQRARDTPTNTDHGSVSRFYVSLDLTFAPVKMLDRLSTTLSGKTWRDASRSGFYDQGSHNHQFESISIDWELVPKQRAIVGLSREVGENPTEGLPKSAVTKVAFKFKFN